MLRPRLIVSLLLKNGGLVKTIKFSNPKYVGDPINAVKIYNEKEVDELVIFDIDASINSLEPNYELLKVIAKQARMPICYGGGIKTIDQAERIYQSGIEKIAISSAAVYDPMLIKTMVEKLGSQSVVVVLDMKKNSSDQYQITIENGSKWIEMDPLAFVCELQKIGIGEIILNNVDRDGTYMGYDLKLAQMFQEKLEIPLTILGGAGSLDDLKLASNQSISGIAAGSLFTFIGQYSAVLLNYPNKDQKIKIINNQYEN